MILVWELLLKFKLLEIVDWNDDGDDDDANDDALDDDDGKNDDIDDQMILGWVLQCGWPGWAFIIVVLPLALGRGRCVLQKTLPYSTSYFTQRNNEANK